MPDDIPKAVMVLVWLLVGLIIFGWLLMDYKVVTSIVFALVYFGLPIPVYMTLNKKKS